MKAKLATLSVLALAAACGGSGVSTQDFQSNAPSFSELALQESDADTAEPAATAGDTQSAALVEAAAATCHPHLFMRSHEIVARVNRHFMKHLRHVEALIRRNPALSQGGTKTWENVDNGIDRKLTITATVNADGSVTYDFELDLKSTGDFVKVMDGEITHAGSSGGASATATENKGTVNFDYSALATVITTERARGQLSDTFDNLHDPVKGVKRTSTITLTNFLPEEGDPHGPRNGAYTHLAEPGVGGYIAFQDSLVLLCPSNPGGAVADTQSLARWYKAADGTLHARSDAQATGGQIAAGDKWEGVTCANGPRTATPIEGEWMMKLEDASGNTIMGTDFQSGVTPCDAAFGPVPGVNDNKTDYDFSAAVTFPNEWQ